MEIPVMGAEIGWKSA